MGALFIGSFLSAKTGTKPFAEKAAVLLREEGFEIGLRSRINNLPLRMLDICLGILLTRSKTIHFDVFSGRAFMITDIGSRIARILGKRILFTLRGGALIEFEHNHGNRVNRVLERAELIQTPSKYLQEYFQSKGFSVRYSPNPVDLRNFPFLEGRPGPLKLLWVRAFSSIYQPELAIRALYEIRNFNPEATLTMVGPDKGILAEMQTLIIKLQLEDAVRIVGPIPNSLLYTFYQSHTIYLNTTRYESFGVALVEAAACGIPIVSTEVGEIPYIWNHGETIILCSTGTPVEFAENVQSLFKSKESRTLQSRRARIVAEKFSWEHIKHEWISLLKA